MTPESWITLFILSMTAAFTPGPNNALVASSGVNFGYRRSLPHILGISLGYGAMIFIVAVFTLIGGGSSRRPCSLTMRHDKRAR